VTGAYPLFQPESLLAGAVVRTAALTAADEHDRLT
jgi:hypothetical protein